MYPVADIKEGQKINKKRETKEINSSKTKLHFCSVLLPDLTFD